MAVERDGPGRPAIQPFREPVIHGLLDCVIRCGPRAGVLLGLELSQFRGDLGSRTAGDLMAPPSLPVRPVADRDSRIPAALGLVFINRTFAAPAAAGPDARSTHGREPNTACSPYCSRRLLTCSI